jgi:hypothetical protein
MVIILRDSLAVAHERSYWIFRFRRKSYLDLLYLSYLLGTIDIRITRTFSLETESPMNLQQTSGIIATIDINVGVYASDDD